MFASFTARSFAAMEKPAWRRRSSTYLVESEHMKLRSDEVELPNGTILPAYYVRESSGFVAIFALTPEREVVLLRQYRYGADAIIVELPAGTIDHGEDPLHCAQRELAEETGYTAPSWELVFTAPAEPVRSNSIMHVYLARDARRTTTQSLDPTETIEPFTVSLETLRQMLRNGEVTAVSAIAAAYAVLDRLQR
jgi:ADP-ribose pyrophosphatase